MSSAGERRLEREPIEPGQLERECLERDQLKRKPLEREPLQREPLQREHQGTRGAPSPGRTTEPGAVTEHWPAALPGTRFCDIRHLAEVASTNQLALDAAMAGTQEGLVVVADHQSAGRGRLGRRWEAPAGTNLLVSMLLRPRVCWEDLHRFTAVVAMAAADACREVAGVELAGKWPNDLVALGAETPHDWRAGSGRSSGAELELDSGKALLGKVQAEEAAARSDAIGGQAKVAGVLAEAVPSEGGDRAPAGLVVGIGINVGWPGPAAEGSAHEGPAADRSAAEGSARVGPAAEGPAAEGPTHEGPAADRSVPEGLVAGMDRPLDQRATSLWVLAGWCPSRAAVLVALLRHAERRLHDLETPGGPRRQAEAYRRWCSTLGEQVRVELPTGIVVGTAIDITETGALVVDDGLARHVVRVGDVVHLRRPA